MQTPPSESTPGVRRAAIQARTVALAVGACLLSGGGGVGAQQAAAACGVARAESPSESPSVSLDDLRTADERIRQAEAEDSAALLDALRAKAVLLQRSGQRDSAVHYRLRMLKVARARGDDAAAGDAAMQAGLLTRTLRPADALAFFREALSRRRDDTPSRRASALGAIAATMGELGLADSALAYYASALEIYTAERAPEAAQLLGNMAEIHRGLGRLDSAEALARRALNERPRGPAGDRLRVSALTNLGLIAENRAYARGGRAGWSQAASFYQQALRVADATHQCQDAGRLHNNLGVVYRRQGDTRRALASYRTALPFARAAADSQLEARVLHNVGLVHGDEARADSALHYLRASLPFFRAARDRWWEGLTWLETAHVFHRVERPARLPDALAAYDSAASALSAAAAATGGDASRVTFADQRHMLDLFEEWALAALARAGDAPGTDAGLRALAAAERGRAQALLHLVRGAAGARGDLPASTADVASTIARARGRADAALVYLAARDTLVTWLVRSPSDLRVTRAAVTRDSVARLASALRQTLGISGGGTRDLPSRLDPPPPPAVAARGAINPASAAAVLGRLLLPDSLLAALPESAEVVVVPHGPLGTLPFAALRVGGVGTRMGERYAVRYAPSLATLAAAEHAAAGDSSAEAGSRAAWVAAGGALVVGDPVMPPVRGDSGRVIRLPQLTFAAAEADSIAAYVGADPLRGAAAGEGAVRARITSVRLVHLATHGFAYSSESRARSSFVALAKDERHDGLLTVGEVLDLAGELRAELVVLSACQTGLGDPKQAEGTVGLQRAFLAKRARSVLVSLWNVSDPATSLLMRRFYAHWLNDADRPTKAVALRRAQADVRRTAGFEHPRFWGAFQLVGAG